MNFIEMFSEAFLMTMEDWKFWEEQEGRRSDKLIIAGPSRIVGLLDLTKLEEIEWKEYSIESKPTNKMCGNFVFDGGMYSMDFLKKAFHFLSESFEVARVREVIIFKLSETIGLGLAEKINGEGWYYNDEGIMFVEWKFEGQSDKWKTVTTAKEFIKWENNMAKRKHSGKTQVWYEEVYRFEKFFEEEEEWGDMMMP